jgi:crotonobetainyl-CoA:carnitine CoA-transferase CaiB-like acyl-CoA transferase
MLSWVAEPSPGATPVPSPVQTANDFVARGMQVEVEQPQLGRTVRYPGPPYAFGKTPWAVSRPAPTLGQHTEEVLAAAGVDAARRPVREG